MAAADSTSLASVALFTLPFVVLTLVLRFYIRISRKAWGADDWAMMASIPFFIVTTVSMTTLAFSGLGKRDAELETEEMKRGLFWYFMSGTIWTFWILVVKWSIGFTILRIATGKRWVTWSIYIALALMTMASGSTGLFQFAQCKPLKSVWDFDIKGDCLGREILANLSTALAAVSIATDWYLALIASVAGIVRFVVLVKATPAIATGVDYLYVLDPIMTWALEPALGTIAANLPALRPLLERALVCVSKMTSRSRSGANTGTVGSKDPSQYVELEEREKRCENASRNKKSQNVIVGLESRIYGKWDGTDLERDSSSSVGDDGSQIKIVSPKGIRVDRKFEVSRD